MKSPTLDIIAGKKVVKELVYTLRCKKNDCLKVEIHRYEKENGELKLLMTRSLKGNVARKFLEDTKDMRIKLEQHNPIKKIVSATKIPWVYGKSINGDVQVARYMDESGDRAVFRDNKWKKEVFKFDINSFTI